MLYEPKTQSISLCSAETEVNLQIGSAALEINGQTSQMPVAAKIENNRTMIPLRATTEALGCDVSWEQETQTITLTRPYQMKRIVVYSENTDTTDAETVIVGNDMTVLQFETEEAARNSVVLNEGKGLIAEPDYIHKEASLSWGTDRMNAPSYRNAYAGNQSDLIVAVIDTGLDSSNTCFNNRVVSGYEAHTACDKNGFVLEAVVTAGNVHDSVAFDDVYDKLVESFPEIETIVADSAYKTPHICKKIFDDGRVISTAYKRPMTKKGGHEWWKYVYDEYYDCIICPEYQILEYRTTNREGYREYKSKADICKNCPTRHLCTESKDCVKTVTKHIWSEYIELAEDIRHTPEYAELYKQRKEKIERVFADAKEKHGMRYTPYTGLEQVTNWVRLKFAAMNLKKLAKWKWKGNNTPSKLLVFLLNFIDVKKNPDFA